MNVSKFPWCLPFILVLAGCDLVSSQYPLGSTRYPPPYASVGSGIQSSSAPQPIPQAPPPATGSQRRQHVWQRALEGMVMGAAVGGIYGAGGGLVIGLLTGFFTADAHYTQVNNQIQSEYAKDRELEAKLEQEIQRQRELEAQIVNRAGNPTQQNPPDPQAMEVQNATNVTMAAMKKGSGALASLSQKETTSNSPRRPFKNVEVKDVNGDGIPDLWIYYSPLKADEIVRQEEATRWDGRVDTWSYFKDGKLVRREIDSKGRGVADTVYHYENDKMVREERDENGNGHVSFRAIYQNGRRTMLEKDSNGRGKIDQWIYFDTTRDGEIVLKEERDLNGDGVVDLWSYYENGRLARQDVSAVGAELLSKQDRFSSSPADTKNTPRPQLVR
jgi:hypothetical protein